MILLNLAALAAAGLLPSSKAAFNPPIPSKQQLKWMDWEVGAMITYSMQTYSHSMKQGDVVPATRFTPVQTRFTDTWVDAARSFGA